MSWLATQVDLRVLRYFDNISVLVACSVFVRLEVVNRDDTTICADQCHFAAMTLFAAHVNAGHSVNHGHVATGMCLCWLNGTRLPSTTSARKSPSGRRCFQRRVVLGQFFEFLWWQRAFQSWRPRWWRSCKSSLFVAVGTTFLASGNLSAVRFDFNDVIVTGPSNITATSGNITISGRISSEDGENNDLLMNTTGGGHIVFEGDIGATFNATTGGTQINASHMGEFTITGNTSTSNVTINSNNVSAGGFNITAANINIGNDGSNVNPATTNVAGTGTTNITLNGTSSSGNLTTPYLNLTGTPNVTLTGNVSVNTNGGDADLGTINNSLNGNFDLSLNVGTGNMTLGTVGNSTAINNMTLVSTGNTTLNGNITANGAGGIDLTGATPVIIGNDIEINSTGTGLISLADNVTTNDNNLTFGGDVNLTQSIIISGGNGTITFGTANGDNVTIADNLTISAAEIDFRGGTDSVSGGNNVTLQPNDINTAMNVGGVIDTTANVLEISDTDLDALGQSAVGSTRDWTSLTLGRADGLGGGNFGSTNYVFNDPTTLVQYNNVSSTTNATSSTIFTSTGDVTINMASNTLNWYLDAQLTGSLTVNNNANTTINLGDAATTVGSDINATTITFGNSPVLINQDTVLAANSTITFPSANVSGAGDLALAPRTAGIAVSVNGGATFDVNTAAFTGLTGGLIIGGTVLNTAGDLVVSSFSGATLQTGQTALSGTLDISGAVTFTNTDLVLLSSGDITINSPVTATANSVSLLSDKGSILNGVGSSTLTVHTLNLVAHKDIGTTASAIQISVPNGATKAQFAIDTAGGSAEVYINNLVGAVASPTESVDANALAIGFDLVPNLSAQALNTASLFAASQVKSSLDDVGFIDAALFDESIELFGRQNPAVQVPETQKEDYLSDFVLDTVGSTDTDEGGAAGGASGDGTETDTPLGSDPLGSDPLGSDPLGSDPLGSDPLGSDPLGSDPLGSDPLGSDPNEQQKKPKDDIGQISITDPDVVDGVKKKDLYSEIEDYVDSIDLEKLKKQLKNKFRARFKEIFEENNENFDIEQIDDLDKFIERVLGLKLDDQVEALIDRFDLDKLEEELKKRYSDDKTDCNADPDAPECKSANGNGQGNKEGLGINYYEQDIDQYLVDQLGPTTVKVYSNQLLDDWVINLEHKVDEKQRS